MLGGLIVTRNGPLERFRTFLLLISTVISVSRHRPSLKSSVRPQPAAHAINRQWPCCWKSTAGRVECAPTKGYEQQYMLVAACRDHGVHPRQQSMAARSVLARGFASGRMYSGRSKRGLFAGKDVLFGNNVSHSQRK